ncbi:ECF transporter S component [Aerococcaceae bacterium WGS1372]
MNTQKFVKIAVMAALTTAVSLLFVFPVPAANGIVTLAEAGIYISALLLGPMGGFWVGFLSGTLTDLLSGYPQWIVFSALIHGVQGYVAATIFTRVKGKASYLLSLLGGSIIMVVGYFLATVIMYDLPAALASIPANAIQNILGVAVAIPVVVSLKKLNIKSIEESNANGTR